MTDHTSDVEQRRSGLQRSRNVATGSLGWTQAMTDWHLLAMAESQWWIRLELHDICPKLQQVPARVQASLHVLYNFGFRQATPNNRAHGFYTTSCLQSDFSHLNTLSQTYNIKNVVPLQIHLSPWQKTKCVFFVFKLIK